MHQHARVCPLPVCSLCGVCAACCVCPRCAVCLSGGRDVYSFVARENGGRTKEGTLTGTAREIYETKKKFDLERDRASKVKFFVEVRLCTRACRLCMRGESGAWGSVRCVTLHRNWLLRWC